MVLAIIVLACITSNIFLAWMQLYVHNFAFDLICDQKNLISMDRERCFLIVSFEIPVAVMLSQCMGVAGCGWPISCKVIRIILPSLQLRNNAPNSASAADATTNLRITHMIQSAPLSTIGLVGLDLLPRKNCPYTRLIALVSER